METTPLGAALLVLGFAAAPMAPPDGYFRCVRMPPPHFGVMNLYDVAVMIAAIVAVPYLFLVVPTPLMTLLLGGPVASILSHALESVLNRPARWAVVVAVIAAELIAYLTAGGASAGFALMN